MKAGYPTVQNQAWTSEIGHSYVRMPDRAEAQVRKPLWDLSRNSAGLALYFTTNSPTITVRYKISGAQAMPHMPATGVSGVDLYRIDSVGGQDFCFGSYSFGPKVQYSYSALAPSDLSGADREYHLNLPLYNTIDSLEIGVAEGSRFSPAEAHREAYRGLRHLDSAGRLLLASRHVVDQYRQAQPLGLSSGESRILGQRTS